MARLKGTLMEEELHSTFKGDPYGRSTTGPVERIRNGINKQIYISFPVSLWTNLCQNVTSESHKKTPIMWLVLSGSLCLEYKFDSKCWRGMICVCAQS